MLNRRRKKEEKGAPKWMVTFSDLMTLILVFFILLFSMSVVDAQKFRAIAESFQQRQIFDFMPSAIEFQDPNEIRDSELNDPDETEPEDQDLNDPEDDIDSQMDELLEEVTEFLNENDLNDLISASREDRGVVLVLQERTLFESGEAELLDDAQLILDKVGSLLEVIPNVVKVEGHTDSRPISTYRYPSNWELSGARSSSVIRYLIDEFNLDASRFISTGYGDTRPLVENTSAENMSQNRRVVIVISDPEYDESDLY